MSTLARSLRAWPTLLKVSFAEAVAYRAEFLIWILTTTMPFIMMALMTSLAREAPVKGYGVEEFTAYYLATLLVRLLTGAWVVWEMTQEIRQGTMALRLLRPIHPFVSYASDNLAALPLRGMLAIPLIGAILFFASEGVTRSPTSWALALVAIFDAWLLNFLVMCCIGCLAFLVESATSVFEVWLGIWVLLSGYLVPLDLFPPWVEQTTGWLPFRLMLDLPVGILIERHDHQAALLGIGMQWLWILAFGALATFLWRLGMRRFQAFGG